MERRRLLQAGAGFTLASGAGALLSPAQAHAGTDPSAGAAPAGGQAPAGRAAAIGAPAHCSGTPITTHGTASLTAAIVSMSVLGDKAYVVARGQNPPVLGEIDLPSKTLVRAVRLNRGEGGWATTVSGGQIYAGTYPFPDIYRFDPVSGEVRLIGTVGPAGGFVWCLTTAPDGTVYAGTSPRGEVWEYKPSTGTLRNLGVAVAGQQYVRAIAADDHYVYAGTLPSGYVVAYDRTTGAKTNITPTPYGGAAAMIARGGRVIAGLTRSLVDMAPDGSDARVIPTPAAERLIDAMAMTADGTLYCVGRPTGTVYRREGTTLVPVTAPTPGDEHRALVPLDARTLLGCAGSGRLWWLDLDSNRSDIVELIDAGLSGPDPVQSMAYGSRGTVHVGGHYSITTHRPATGAVKRTSVAGEPKQLQVVHGRVYAAMYPSAEMLELDPDRGRVRSLGFIENDQQRPTDMAYDAGQDQLLVASAPGVGLLKGALTVVDRSRRRLTVHKDIIQNQSVMSLALEEEYGRHRIVYLAGDTWGGGSVPPARPSATIVAFDLRRRKVLWEVTPVEGYASFQHITVHDGVLYGLYKRLAGSWFAMDLETRTVLRSGRLPSYGELSVHGDQVYASIFGGSVYRIGPDLAEPELVVSGLGDGWYNPPQLAWENRSWYAWGTANRSLARLRLDPRCSPAARTRNMPPDHSLLEGLLAH
ncbi:hypothetical protein [Streptomyces sp. NPDC020965]|uniref:hypothetical protein n=1 Tax=Streptomyces sp. NPDC020965 TaxID=3365105 RepID=UPI00378EE38A